MATQTTKQYAQQLLDSLKELDRMMVRAYYEMGRILTSIADNNLYDLLGYDSLTAMIEEELTFAPTSGSSYMKLYRELRRLKYNKTESIKLLETFGMRHLLEVLPKLNTKVGARAIKNRVDELDRHQFTFWMHGDDYLEVLEALEKYGLYMKNDRMMNSSEALAALARAVNGTEKKKVA